MKKSYLYFIVPAAIAALTACGDKEKKQGPPPPTAVNVAEAKQGHAIYYDQFQGTVASLNSVELRSQVPGYITGIFFKEGEIVPKGKVLYEVDRRKYQAAYDQANANVLTAQANLVKAKKDIDRYQMLLKQDAVARQTVDNAEAAYASAQSNVEVAKAARTSAATDLSFSIIKAPVTGRIGISQVRLGAVIGNTTLLNTISSENPIAVDVVIGEQDINRFYDLQRRTTDSTFRLTLPDGTIYNKSGKIFAIDRGVNNTTGTIKVRMEFDNSKGLLRDGMSTALKVLNDQSGQRIIIPYRAITEQMGEFFVFKTQGDTMALQTKVKIGPRLVDSIVVVEGIKAGDHIITDGFQRLRDSGKVTLGPPPGQGPQGGAQGGAKQQQGK